VREALAQMLGAIDANAIDSPHVRHAQTGEDTHKWHEEWEQRGKQALATLNRVIEEEERNWVGLGSTSEELNFIDRRINDTTK